MLIMSLAAYDRSALRLVSVCTSRFGSKVVGLSGPSEALTVSNMKVWTWFWPWLTLTSQLSPGIVVPRTPATTEKSRRSPPNCGVKPPGKPFGAPANGSWKVKQFGSSRTAAKATGSGVPLTMFTVGQLAEPMPFAASTSPTSSVSPPSTEYTLPRLFGLRK